MDESYGKNYRQLYQRHWWWRSREAAILDLLRTLGRPGCFGNILDVGCGDGLFFDQLSQFGDVEGVESSDALLDPNGPHRSRIYTAAFDSHFQPGKRYGLITMLDVLEHLPDPVDALRHALSLLSDSGRLVITVPAFNLLWTTHDDLNHHRARYTKQSFSREATQAGMRIDLMRYWYQWTFPVKLLARAIEAITRPPARTPRVPPRPVNRALFTLSRLEQKAFTRFQVPFGSSLVVVGGHSRQHTPE